MEIEIVVDITKEIEGYDNLNLDFIEEFVTGIIESEYSSEEEKDVYLSIMLTDNDSIQEINAQYREKDEPTDVISFAYHEGEEVESFYDTLGDIIISLERVEAQSKEYGHTFEREFYYVLTHGILHLLGYDHMNDEDKEEMRQKEEELLEKYNFRRD